MFPMASMVLCANPAPLVMSCETQGKALNPLKHFVLIEI